MSKKLTLESHFLSNLFRRQASRLLAVFTFTMVLSASSFGGTVQENLPRPRCLDLLISVSGGWRPIEGSGSPERWSFDGQDGAKYYDQDFHDLYAKTGEKSLAQILESRKRQGRKNNVLDIFGSGFFVENQSLTDSVTGMRLGPFLRETDDDDLKPLIAKLPPTPTEVLGDAMNPKTWVALHESMRNRGIATVDLVAMRPFGGWKQAGFTRTAEQNALGISFIVENVLQVLSSDGQFYFSVNIPQLPGDLRQHPILQELVRQVESQTKYHLSLSVKMSTVKTTYELSGVLYPK